MKDQECVHFLQWALPQLHLSWPGFRRVRRQICKRIDRRLRNLGLADIAAYQGFLTTHPGEWLQLDALCHITISRFYRDRGVFACLEQAVIPTLAEQARARGHHWFRVWSAGCCSGEEPYTLAILWHEKIKPRFSGIDLVIVATDADPIGLQRARRACYPFSSLKELPINWRKAAFIDRDGVFCLKDRYRSGVAFMEQDVRHQIPEDRFDLVLCRNLVFTYFDEMLQRKILRRLEDCLRVGGALVLGKHEKIPGDMAGWLPWFNQYPIYRKQWQ